MGEPELLKITPERAGAETAIVFVHGFGGDAAKTWGEFPRILREEKKLSDWAIYSLGYQSQLMPDVRGVWAGDPGIPTLATHLHTRATQDPLKGRRLAFIAHSMGGLVVQSALVTHPDLLERTSHVLLYGTPSNGLDKASGLLARLFKRQTEDMGLASGFVSGLRASWRKAFGDREAPLPPPTRRPFVFFALAGDRDEFVPAVSSLGPFADADRVVVPGNHLEIVKPDGPDSMSARAAVDAIVGDAAPGGPWNAARCAVEMGDFNEAIATLEPNADDLDEPSAVELALALDAVGRRQKAIEVLEIRRKKGGTDAMGTLAGRLKRVWWSKGTETPARAARDLYVEAYRISRAAGDVGQAYYHGINVAFMELAFERDEEGARKTAAEVLDLCAQVAKPDVWCLATIGEAHFYLGDPKQGLASYERAVATRPEPWQMKSMFTQAVRVCDALDDDASQRELERIFQQTGAS